VPPLPAGSLLCALCLGASGLAARGVEQEEPSPVDTVATSLPAQPPPELRGALVSAADLGLPIEWVIRDLDPSVPIDDVVAPDIDPFLGLLECPEGAIREGADGQWIARRFSAPQLPLENGLLSVEVIVEIESAADAAADREALDECEPPEFGELTVETVELEPPSTSPAGPDTSAPAEPIPATALELLSTPTADVPYPSAFDLITAYVDGHTVTVILGGVDMAVSWRPIANQIAWQIVEAIGS
jgi:hypothetical protein